MSFFRPCQERQKYARAIIALQRRYCYYSVLATIGKTCKKSSEVLYLLCNIAVVTIASWLQPIEHKQICESVSCALQRRYQFLTPSLQSTIACKG